MQKNISETKAKLSELVAAVERGEDSVAFQERGEHGLEGHANGAKREKS